MREIIFRGKRIDNGEWAEGFYAKTIQGNSVTFNTIDECPCGFCMEMFDSIKNYVVIPETVGQYTGLTDKNGKKIFEGDIVKFCDIKGVINYGTGCYCVKTNKPDWKSRNNPAIDIVLNEYENELEIIGNITDNPELIKEA